MCNISSVAQTPCETVSVQAYDMYPQSGAHNYFGARVTLSQVYGQDVTVTGYIHAGSDEWNNQDHPFTLTVTAGSLTAETAADFYETDPTGDAAVTVASITPCPPATNESFQQQCDHMLDYIKYTLEYVASRNIDPSNQTELDNAINIAKGEYNSISPGLDFTNFNYTDLRNFVSTNINDYPQQAHSYIIRLNDIVYNSDDRLTFENAISNLSDSISNSSLEQLLKEKLLTVCTTLKNFSLMMQAVHDEYPVYFERGSDLTYARANIHNGLLKISSVNLESYLDFNSPASRFEYDFYRSWWQRWGRCAAGIVGGTGLGVLTGAAAGSVVPALGTVAGGILGGIFGGLSGASVAC